MKDPTAGGAPMSASRNEGVPKITLGHFDLCYKACENCGYDAAKSGGKNGKDRCWKCGRKIHQDFSARALKPEYAHLAPFIKAPPQREGVEGGSEPALFAEVWDRLRPFMPDAFTTRQAIIVMDHFGCIKDGPCTCGLEIYGDHCVHHSLPLPPPPAETGVNDKTEERQS